MAMMQTDGARRGKAVDHEIPLIPFIDLLLCCVMFLLVTAVWNELAAVPTNLPGAQAAGAMDAVERSRLFVDVEADRYVVLGSDGTRVEVPRDSAALALAAHLESRPVADRLAEVAVRPDDGVPYDALVRTLDVLRGQGFAHIGVASP